MRTLLLLCLCAFLVTTFAATYAPIDHAIWFFGGTALGLAIGALTVLVPMLPQSEAQIDAVILAVLRCGDDYGYGVNARIAKLPGQRALGPGTLYPALRRLEGFGLLESYEKPDEFNERGGRPRIFYRLTDEGVAVADRSALPGEAAATRRP